MTVLHTGSTKKFSTHWEDIFQSGRKSKPAKETSATATNIKSATKQKKGAKAARASAAKAAKRPSTPSSRAADAKHAGRLLEKTVNKPAPLKTVKKQSKKAKK